MHRRAGREKEMNPDVINAQEKNDQIEEKKESTFVLIQRKITGICILTASIYGMYELDFVDHVLYSPQVHRYVKKKKRRC